MSPRSLGVEEEFLLVEPGTGRPQAVAGTILRAARPELEAELQEQQLETNSRPCRSLDELYRELRRCRASAAEEAERVGAHVVALGEHCWEALADAGDAGAVAELLADLVARGNGAAFQREEYRRTGRLPEMISRAVDITAS